MTEQIGKIKENIQDAPFRTADPSLSLHTQSERLRARTCQPTRRHPRSGRSVARARCGNVPNALPGSHISRLHALGPRQKTIRQSHVPATLPQDR